MDIKSKFCSDGRTNCAEFQDKCVILSASKFAYLIGNDVCNYEVVTALHKK